MAASAQGEPELDDFDAVNQPDIGGRRLPPQVPAPARTAAAHKPARVLKAREPETGSYTLPLFDDEV